MRWYFLERQGQQNRDEQVGNQLKVEPADRIQLLVREVLQNSLDARAQGSREDDPDTGPTVQVSFDLFSIEGSRLAELRLALQAEELEQHLQAEFKDVEAAPTESDVKALAEGPLWVLRIVERNTTGLTGPEDLLEGPSPFAALTKDQFSRNPNVNAGGSYGVGKSVLWKFNQTRTVLFLTRVRPSPESDIATRFIGRTELRQRKVDGRWKLGSGWLCGGEGEVTDSVWGLQPDELLSLGFEGGENWSTQILILGLQPEIAPPMESAELVESPEWNDLTVGQFNATMRCEIAQWFWPAMMMKRIQVKVGGQEVTPGSWPPCRAYEEALRVIRDNEPTGLQAEIKILCPKRIDVADYPQCEQSARVALRRVSDGSQVSVARFRYPGMVVDYWRGVDAKNEGEFVGVLPCGTFLGAHTDLSARSVQFFLRMAENETHDKWTPASANLDRRFPVTQRNATAKSALNTLEQRMKVAIEALILPAITSSPAASRLFADFHLPGNQTPKPGPRDPSVELLEYHPATKESLAMLRVKIKPRTNSPISITLRRPHDNGKGEPVEYSVLGVEGGTFDSGVLNPASSIVRPIVVTFSPHGMVALKYDLIVKELHEAQP